MTVDIPLRFVKVAEAREQLQEAHRLIRYLAKYAAPLDKMRKENVNKWILKLPAVFEGLPQTFELDSHVCYRDPAGSVIDGVVVGTVTCHEQYVVAPGDSRTDMRKPMYKIDASLIVRRGEIPPLSPA